MSRSQFSSPIAAIITMAGASIGLGNIWRFPYMMGSYGGSAFLLVYLLFVVLIAVPALSAEWALGRRSGGGTIVAFTRCFGAPGRILGYILVLGMLLSGSYYIVVIGSVADMTMTSLLTGFSGDFRDGFLGRLESGAIRYAYALAILGAIVWVAWLGVNNGIERVSKWFVPIFFIVILYLIFSTLRLEGAGQKMLAFLKPDFSVLNPGSIFAALGQAIFSVGLGGTVMVVYGSYMNQNTSLWRGAMATVGADTMAALLAALFIFPTILVFGISPASGPTLLFETLSQLFGQMDNGRIVGSFFLVALLLMAFLSGLAALEVVISSVSDEASRHGLTRKRTIIVFGLIEATIIALPAFKPSVIGIMDLVFGSGMLALGSGLAIIGLAWSLGRKTVIDEYGGGATAGVLYLWLKWVIPAVIGSVLVLSYFS